MPFTTGQIRHFTIHISIKRFMISRKLLELRNDMLKTPKMIQKNRALKSYTICWIQKWVKSIMILVLKRTTSRRMRIANFVKSTIV